MRVDGPRFGAVFKVNFQDVHANPDNDYLRLRSPMVAIMDVFEGREDQAALLIAPDPKTQRMHTYVATNDPDLSKEQSLRQLQRLAKLPSKGKVMVPSNPLFGFPQAHRFSLTSIEHLAGEEEVPTVDFEYDDRQPVRKNEFIQRLGLLEKGKIFTIAEDGEEDEVKP